MLIRKIKKSDLESLGEGWAEVSPEELLTSGIAVEADELLVYEEVAPANGENESDTIKELRSTVHKLNKESASRRITLRDVTAQLETLKTENATLKSKDVERALNDKKSSAKELFNAYVAEKKHVFVSDVAGDDLREGVFGQVDWTKEVTKETLAALIDDAVTKKSYVLKTVTLPTTEGGGQGEGSGTVVMDDDFLAEVAGQFNIPIPKPIKE